MDLAELEEYEPMRLLLQENARLNAILYSIFKRHPDVEGWSLVLNDVDQDIPPDPLVVGWNTIGSSAIITLVFGQTRQAMIEAEAKDWTTGPLPGSIGDAGDGGK